MAVDNSAAGGDGASHQPPGPVSERGRQKELHPRSSGHWGLAPVNTPRSGPTVGVRGPWHEWIGGVGTRAMSVSSTRNTREDRKGPSGTDEGCT